MAITYLLYYGNNKVAEMLYLLKYYEVVPQLS